MALADLPRVTKELTNKELSNILAMVIKELEFVVNGRLDVKNIKADGIEARNIKARAVVADKIDVDELSAITADMGKLTSGEIYGAYIATAEGSYPRAEMSSAGDLFAAYATISKYINILANESGDPLLYFNSGSNLVRIALLASTFSIGAFANMVIGATGDLNISATSPTSNVTIEPGSSGKINFPGWNKISSLNTGKTLQQSIDERAVSGASTGSAGGHNHGVSPGRYIMTYDAAGKELGLQQWVAASAHSHPQT